jgi:hypothetical protein
VARKPLANLLLVHEVHGEEYLFDQPAGIPFCVASLFHDSVEKFASRHTENRTVVKP